MIKKYKQFLETFSYQVSEQERDSISKNISFGFNFPEDAREELNWLLDTDYPKGYKNMPEQVYLYRLLFLEDGKKLDSNRLGYHWIMNPEIIDKNFIETIRSTSDAPWVDPIIIKGLFNSEDLDWVDTIHHNMNFPSEQEITTKSEPISFEVYDGLEKFKNSEEN